MIRIEKLVHNYTVWESETKKSKKLALDGISLDIPSGQFVAILGPNGCGKSTLAKHLNALLLPDQGCVYIDGKNTSDVEALWKIRQQVGMVFQNPDNQIIGASVEEDTAFGPENRCVPSDEIRKLVGESLRAVNLEHKRRVSPSRLSGGQKQRVATAGVIACRSTYMVLDEPTAMLDPTARRDMMRLILRLNREMGITVVLITHHTDEVVDADSVVLMNQGKILCQGTPREIFSQPALLKQVKMDIPQVTELGERLQVRGMPIQLPVLREAELIEQLKPLLPADRPVLMKTQPDWSAESSEQPLLTTEHICYSYGTGTAEETPVLRDVSLKIWPGECIGLVGVSGSGKTTLIKHLNGLLKASSGDVRFAGRSIYEKKYKLSGLRKEVGLVFQYPENQLFGQTVLKDVCFGPLNMGMSPEEAERAACESLSLVGIGEENYYASPLETSGGQRRRIAIAGVLAMHPKILILDEPAAGLDPATKHMIFDLLTRIKRERNIAIVLVSHHMEDVAQYADRVYVLDKGTLVMEGAPREVFRSVRQLKEMGIGVPAVSAFTEDLRTAGYALPRPAVTVPEAEEMIVNLWKGGAANA